MFPLVQVEFLQSWDMSPGSVNKLSGRQNTARPLPALIPRRSVIANGGGATDVCQTQQTSAETNTRTVPDPYCLFKRRFNLDSPQIRAPQGRSRGHQMVNSALQKSFAMQEKQKYSDVLINGFGGGANTAPQLRLGVAAAPSVRVAENSLFGALKQRKSVLNRLPFSSKDTINIGSRNNYGKLLEKYSAGMDQRNGKSPKFLPGANVKTSACVDLTRNGGYSTVELTDDEEEEEEPGHVNVASSFKIPKSFPCAPPTSQSNPLNVTNPWRSPVNILKALEQVDQDEDEEEEDDNDDVQEVFNVPIVLDYEQDDDLPSSSSATSVSNRSGQPKRKTEAVTPVNSLLDEWKTKSVFKKDWLEATKRRYSVKQEQWSLKIAEEQQRQIELEQANRQDVQEMIKKMDEALLLRELIVVEDEEEAAAQLAKSQEPVDTPLPTFTAEQMNMIRYAAGRGSPNEVLIEKFNMSIKRMDIATLLGDSWLNDEVINFYMNLLMERGENSKYPKVYAMNTFFMPKVLDQGQGGVRRWTRKVDLFSYDLIPVPVHVSNIHWCMAIISLRDKYIRYYDSMGQPNKRVLDALEQYLKDESLDKKKQPFCMDGWLKESVADCPRQMNGSDCGVFSCMFAEYLCRDHRINFSQDNMPYFRQKMILEICTGQLLL